MLLVIVSVIIPLATFCISGCLTDIRILIFMPYNALVKYIQLFGWSFFEMWQQNVVRIDRPPRIQLNPVSLFLIHRFIYAELLWKSFRVSY